MRYFLGAVLPLVVMSGCATDGPAGPESAATVNAVIEQRIEEEVAEGRAQGTPSLNSVPTTPPALPAKAEIAADRAQLQAAVDGVETEIEILRQDVAADALLAEAEALKAAIEADRAAAKRDGSLQEELARQP